MKNLGILKKIKGGLIVSCQALEDEPLHSPYIMSRMAFAAFEGGASGIRANSVDDITEIKKTVNLPIIGLIKKVYSDSDVYITPTMEEVDALAACSPDIIAIDATNRLRPNNETIDAFFKKVREKYPDIIFMADCSTLQDGINAEKLGFDIIGTTLCGYTDETNGTSLPNYNLITELSSKIKVPIIGEGGIWSPQELNRVLNCGAFSAVVGTAITRPMEITKKYVEALSVK